MVLDYSVVTIKHYGINMTNKEIELQGEVESLRLRVAQLEMVVKQLQQPSQVYGPIVVDPTKIPGPWTPKSSPSHPEFKKECPRCGIKMDGPMGFSCPDGECPVFNKVTCGLV